MADPKDDQRSYAAPRPATGQERRTKARSRLSGGSAIAKIIRYALTRLDGLAGFLDGCIEIDSNTIERTMLSIVLTQKNALFATRKEGMPGNR